MDNSRSRQAMDAIASLYLSGPQTTAPKRTPKRLAKPQPRPPAQPIAPHIADAPAINAVQWHIDQALREGHGHDLPSAPDADTALPLTDQQMPPNDPIPFAPLHDEPALGPIADDTGFDADMTIDDHADAAPASPMLEAVFVGNLPGFASPWISQYAHYMTRPDVPVVVAHVDEFEAEVDLYSSRPLTVHENGRFDGPAALIRSLPGPVGTWLFHLHEPNVPAIIELAHHLPTWTFLTGADEAAVVGVYQLIKRMMRETAGRETDPTIRLMFMGCDEQRALTAYDRIARATDAFLETPAEMAGWIPRMQPFHRRSVGALEYDDDDRASIWDQLLDRVNQSSASAPAIEADVDLDLEPDDAIPAFAPQPAEPPSVAAALLNEPDLEPVSETDGPLDDAPPRDMPIEWFDDLRPASTDGLELDEPIDEPVEVGAAEPFAELVDPQPPRDAQDLASCLDDAAPLAARCPRRPEVQLALDATGRLHLMLPAFDREPHEAVSTLIETQAWAAEHRALLALTCQDRELDEQSDPVVHVFTDCPKHYAALAFASTSNGPPLRLHLLKCIDVAMDTVWVHEALN